MIDHHTHDHQAAYEATLVVQRRHETRLLGLPGVTAVATRLLDDGVALVVSVDPAAPVPAELSDREELDGARLVIARERFEPH
jgi:hypothetical protein